LVTRARKIPVASVHPPPLSNCEVPSSATGDVVGDEADLRMAACAPEGSVTRKPEVSVGCLSGGVPG